MGGDASKVKCFIKKTIKTLDDKEKVILTYFLTLLLSNEA